MVSMERQALVSWGQLPGVWGTVNHPSQEAADQIIAQGSKGY